MPSRGTACETLRALASDNAVREPRNPVSPIQSLALALLPRSPNPADWRCDETGVTENLWLNLSTGFIGSGRRVRQWLTAAHI